MDNQQESQGKFSWLSSVFTTIRKLWLLIWKNMLLRRRHYIVTTLEVLLPTLCASIIAYSNKELVFGGENLGQNSLEIGGRPKGTKVVQVREKIYDPIPLELVILKLQETLVCPGFGCPFAPTNEHTRKVILEFQDILGFHGVSARFLGVPNEQEIENLALQSSLSSSKKIFGAAIIFESGFPVTGNKNDPLVSYKIRMKYEYSTYKGGSVSSDPIMPVDDTVNLFPDVTLDPDSHNGERQKMSYIESGFLGLQLALDRALVKMWTGNDITKHYNITVQPFPIPNHYRREQGLSVAYLFHTVVLPTFLVLGFIFIVPSIMRGVVGEKECGIRELLKMNGLAGWLQWIGWLINSMMILILSDTLVIILLFLGTVKFGDPGVWYFILVLYMMAATSFCFFLSTFFIRPTLAITVGIIFWLVSYFPIFIIFELYPGSITLSQSLSASLFPNVAFYLAAKIMMTYERDGIGVQWNNVATPINPGHRLTLGHIIMMFFISTLVFIVLTAYLDNIIVTDYGVRKPWYYPFLPSTWNFKLQNILKKSKVAPGPGANTSELEADEHSLAPGFEAEPSTGDVGIQLVNLRKVYERNKVAVDNVNLKMYHGEIFVLLGHNGAGKTTTISMLSGICAPSGGTAVISGHCISGQLEKVRQKLGLCPQYNMLFERLTVYEHMLFFGLLKGIAGKDALTQLEAVMKKLQLWEKKDTLSKNLSGGQKRKLHLGIALVGDSQVAILDEPTSGMDPEARRAIWDVLLEIRGQRTTLLTTHFMEEADVLGDRIAIMASGKIQCCGTPSFLKKFYGTGYTLKLTLSTGRSTHASLTSLSTKTVTSSRLTPSSDSIIKSAMTSTASSQVQSNASEILTLVQTHVPNAFLKETRSAHAGRAEVFIILPKDTATNDVLTKLFSSLTTQKEKMGVKTMGMSHTTVDEVFLRVGELTEDPVEEEDEGLDNTTSSRGISSQQSFCLLLFCQFNALLIKKIIYTFRKRKLIIGQVIIPVLLLICAIICCNGFFAPLGHPIPRLMSLDDYNRPIIPIFTDGSNQSDTISLLKTLIGSPAKLITLSSSSTPIETLLKTGNTKRFEYYRDHYIAGAHLWAGTNANASSGFNILYSTVPNHAAPLAVNIASNMFLKKLGPSGNNFRIQVTNQPLRTDMKLVVGSAKPEIQDIFYATVLFEVFMPIGLALLAATFIVLPVEEKLCKSKQLQMMTGVHPVLFWGSAFIWDFFIVVLVVFAMVCCFPIFQSHEMYTSYGGVWVAFLILVTYGFCSIPFSYLMSYFANSVSGGFAFVTIIHIISGLVIGIVVSALDMLVVFKPQSSVRAILQSIGRLFPTYGAVISTTRYVETAIDNGRCNILTPEAKKLICGNPWSVANIPSEWEYLECCDGCQKVVDSLYANGEANQARALYGIIPECFLPKPYIVWQSPRESLQGTTINVPGIAQELFFMLIMGIVYIILLFLMEYRYFIRELFEKLRKVICKQRLSPRVIKLQSEEGEQMDEDVSEEAERIKDIITEGNLKADALIVGNLSKTFGKFAAVKQLSFGVHHGECFGLLGVNGAGKTTTFRMLTGDERPTNGVEYAFGKCLSKNRKQYLSNIGYCPQFDGIIGVLTGKEMLQLFSKLRGIPGKRGSNEADRWLKKLGLFKSAKVQCRKYSGGMKRRLCAAIAMIGEPSIILLDEPTSGVDPVSRHQFWKVLQSLRNSGQAIILTSHSMEECEALCSRLGIMVNGELQCLGGVQHLKSKFAQGYTLAVKLKSQVSIDAKEYSSLHEEIMKRFEPCIVKDKHNNFVQYEILNTRLSWEFLFKSMEELQKSNEELIEDYSLNETTLEEVFLSFARKQYGGRSVDNLYCSLCC